MTLEANNNPTATTCKEPMSLSRFDCTRTSSRRHRSPVVSSAFATVTAVVSCFLFVTLTMTTMTTTTALQPQQPPSSSSNNLHESYEFAPVRPLNSKDKQPHTPPLPPPLSVRHVLPPLSRKSRPDPLSMGLEDPHAAAAASSSSSAAAAENASTSCPADAAVSWELKVGKVLDTLRHDYPYLLTEQPDFSIYHKDVEVVDPSGVTVHGLSTYKTSFRLLHALVKVLYCPERSGLTFRMCYDAARRNVRINWTARVVPRDIFGGGTPWRRDLHVDGISVYELDPASGLVVQHRMEQLLFNNLPVRPKDGVIAALIDQHTVVTVPSFSKALESSSGGNTVLEFVRPHRRHGRRRLQLPGGGTVSSLFAMEASGGDSSSTGGGGEGGASASPPPHQQQQHQQQYPGLDWVALDSKNKSRKKFGLKPLTPDEFLELEAQVRQMAQANQAQHKSALEAAAEMSRKKQEPSLANFLDQMLGALQEDACESNFDCERPEICCDFGFKKMCCASGTPVIDGLLGRRQWVPALVPVPVENYPPGQGPYDEPRNYHDRL